MDGPHRSSVDHPPTGRNAMTTIHYTLKEPNQGTNPSTARGRLECAQTMRRAIEIARYICSGIGESTSEDTIVTTDRFFVDLHFEGRCRGSEPISYGWTKDLDPPHRWVLRGFCKTVSADDPILAHLLVSHIVSAWQIVGLVNTIIDERGYMPHEDLRSFLGLTAAETMPDDVDAAARQLQAAPQKSWADPVVGATTSHQLCAMAFRFLSNPTHIRWDVEENTYC